MVKTNTSTLAVVCIADLNVCILQNTNPRNSQESALLAVNQAFKCINAKVVQFTFGQLRKNETGVLDSLYNAEILVIDISGNIDISVVLYHLGVRESVKSTVNIVLVSANDESLLKSLPAFQEPNFLVPYIGDEDGLARYVDPNKMHIMTGEAKMVKSKLIAGLPTLSSRLKECFTRAQNETRVHLTSKFVSELRWDRENLKEDELRDKLRKMRRRLDNPELLSPEILLNMILSYRHIQAYCEMLRLVEDIQSLKNYHHLLEPPNIRYYYAFALNRRNGKGDREKALEIINDAIATCVKPFPDLYGLQGRIFKDRFMESNNSDKEALDKAIECYRKGFQESSSDYLGVNLATLLVIAGADRSNRELATVCNMLYINTGRKGNLHELRDYWDVATFFEVCVLWGDFGGAAKAAECMYKLNPPSWNLASTIGNIRLILKARNVKADTKAQAIEIFDFWLEFFEECIQSPAANNKPCTDDSGGNASTTDSLKHEADSSAAPDEGRTRILFPILLVAMGNDSPSPARLHLNTYSEKPNMRICFVQDDQQQGPPPGTAAANHRVAAPIVFSFQDVSELEDGDTDDVGGGARPNLKLEQSYDLVFHEEDIKGISLDPRDKRNMYFFTVQAEDYSINFPCERSRLEFLAAIRASLSENESYLVDEHDDDKPLKFEYETDENGQLIVLGAGSFGTVYAGRETSMEVKIAIKEIKNIPEKDLQPLIEEINLQSRLNHTNIVRYLGSIFEDGVFKILMEHVPGGSLSFLLKKIGGLKEETVAHYSSQILEGLRYLHASKIVHRDIKGDNIMVNMYRGELKIADFGASKRLSGLIRRAGTVAGTMRYMAPELINASKDGYGYPADIWSFGCTVVEMVTGKLPYHDLDALAAFYRAGFYSAHPDIPQDLSEVCKTFILRCFETDPEKRSTAEELLADPYLSMYKRHKRKAQQIRGNSPRPPEPLPLGTPTLFQRLHSENPKERKKIAPLTSLPPDRYRPLNPPELHLSNSRQFSTATSQTAPVLNGAPRDLSLLPLAKLGDGIPRTGSLTPTSMACCSAFEAAPVGAASEAAAAAPAEEVRRRPEQVHSRERASFGGTAAASLLTPTLIAGGGVDDVSDDTMLASKISITSPISSASPMAGSIHSPDNFNVIKSMDQAKKLLSDSLIQFKPAVLTWWVKQTTTTTRLPVPRYYSVDPEVADSPCLTPSSAASSSSPRPPSQYLESDLMKPSGNHLSRERDEHDLLECMFDFFTDALNGGGSILLLRQLFNQGIHNSEVRALPGTANVKQRHKRPPLSFSFDEVQLGWEQRFVSLVSRIIQQQHPKLRPNHHSPDGRARDEEDVASVNDAAIQQIVSFLEKAWYAMSFVFPKPLLDGRPCQQKPHEMLSWIQLIEGIANEALEQIVPKKAGAILRRTKTVSGGAASRGHRPFRRDSPRFRSLYVDLPQLTPPPTTSAPTPWLPAATSATGAPTSTRRVRVVSPSPSLCASPIESAITGADSDNSGDSDPTRVGGCGVNLKRNAHPLRYVKRPSVPSSVISGGALGDGRLVNTENAEVVALELQRNSMRILDELNYLTQKYNQFLREDLEKKYAHVASMHQTIGSSLETLVLDYGPQMYQGISTGHKYLSEWLGELGIPVDDMEKILSHKFGQTDFVELATKDDLWRLGITGGSVLRIWRAIWQLRLKRRQEQAIG